MNTTDKIIPIKTPTNAKIKKEHKNIEIPPIENKSQFPSPPQPPNCG
jgi:hypothetical protein